MAFSQWKDIIEIPPYTSDQSLEWVFCQNTYPEPNPDETSEKVKFGYVLRNNYEQECGEVTKMEAEGTMKLVQYHKIFVFLCVCVFFK